MFHTKGADGSAVSPVNAAASLATSCSTANCAGCRQAKLGVRFDMYLFHHANPSLY